MSAARSQAIPVSRTFFPGTWLMISNFAGLANCRTGRAPKRQRSFTDRAGMNVAQQVLQRHLEASLDRAIAESGIGIMPFRRAPPQPTLERMKQLSA